MFLCKRPHRTLCQNYPLPISFNRAAEVFVNYFIRPDRQGFYAGVLGGPDWYDVRDKATGARETLVRVYVVPRVGVLWFPFQPYVYLDAAFGASMNVSGSESRPLGDTRYSARPLLAFPFIQVGLSLPLSTPMR